VPERRCVLSLALRLSDEKRHSPSEECSIWQALATLLRKCADNEALERQRALLSSPGSNAAVAAVQCAWHRMNAEATMHVELRLAVCGVWEILFADATPGCLGGGEPITHHHTIPSYMPQYVIDARTAEKARKKEQEERQKQVKSEDQLKLKLFKQTINGAVTHARNAISAPHQQNKNSMPSSSVFKLRTVRFTMMGADEIYEKLMEDMVQEYRERAERWVTFENSELSSNPVVPHPSLIS